MRRALLIILCSSLLLTLLYFIESVDAGRAGVGVLNVSPEYRSTRIIQGEGIVKVYLTVSDYNSWRDVYQIDLFVEDRGVTRAHFRFKHYESTTQYNEINKFSEMEGNNYLLLDECSASHSSTDKTVDDRCLLNVVFAFTPVPRSTRILVITYDRGGLIADTSVEYNNTAGNFRNANYIVPFWMDSPVRIPSDLIDVISISTALTAAAVMLVRRRER